MDNTGEGESGKFVLEPQHDDDNDDSNETEYRIYTEKKKRQGR